MSERDAEPAGPVPPPPTATRPARPSRWLAPGASLPGRRPRWATVAQWAYALLGVGVLALLPTDVMPQAHGIRGWILAPIVAYCAALAYGASRLRERSSRHTASRWVFAPLLLHALAGYLGALSLATASIAPDDTTHLRVSIRDVGAVAGLYGLLFGWAAAVVPLVCVARGRVLFLAALAGPGCFVLVVLLMGS